MKRLICLIVTGMVLVGGVAHAQDRTNTEPAPALGNHELPKVLYIVPWKKPVQGESSAARTLVSQVSEELAPIDRDVFRRQMQYQSQLQARQQPNATNALTKPVAP